MNDIDEVECIQHELLAVIGKYHRYLSSYVSLLYFFALEILKD